MEFEAWKLKKFSNLNLVAESFLTHQFAFRKRRRLEGSLMNFNPNWFKCIFLGTSLSLVATAVAQQPQSLATYLEKQNWDPGQKGALIVLNAEGTRTKLAPTNLQAFNRKAVKIGKLTAIVPTDMVLIDDSPKEPNMYDGLPMDAKVLYLLSTLNSRQVETATTQGIGIRDLQEEQQKVFKSLVPSPFAWTTIKVSDKGSYESETGRGELKGDQLNQVRVKIQLGLDFEIGLQGNPRSYTGAVSSDLLAQRGKKVSVRSESEQKKAFGNDARQVVPNKLKASQLNYQSSIFDSEIQLPSQISLKEILKRISTLTGTEIHAHLRVANLPVSVVGSKLRVREVLESLALCVTGTYRSVGSAFVLTSDIEGSAPRKLNFAAWKGNADKELTTRQNQWRKQVLKSGILSLIKFDPKDPLVPDDRTLGYLEKADGRFFPDDKISASNLTPGIRSFLEQTSLNQPTSGLLVDSVGLHSNVQFSFVLPSGESLKPESSNLGLRMMFDPPTYTPHEQPEDTSLFKLNPTGRHPIVVHSESPSTAQAAIDAAKQHGLSEVWLDTHIAAALAACLNRGVKVCLAIRPWRAISQVNRQSIDRDMLGDTGSQLAMRRAQIADWQNQVRSSELSGNGSTWVYDLLDPSAPDLNRRWDELAKLAHQPGLDGIIVLDSEPLGYEPTDDHTNYGGYPNWLRFLNEFGYSDEMRLAFLREHHIDPIDIDDPELYIDIDLEQPFFPEYAYQKVGGTNDESQDMRLMLDAWNGFRANLNLKATQNFFERLNDVQVPVYVRPRSTVIHLPPDMGQFVVRWLPGEPLPKFDPGNRSAKFPDLISTYGLEEEPSTVVTRNLRYRLNYPSPVAVDLTEIKPDRVSKFLDRWFQKTPTDK